MIVPFLVVAAAATGVTPEQNEPAPRDPWPDVVALTFALPPTLMLGVVPLGLSAPEHRPHTGSIHFVRVTLAVIFLIAIGLVSFGT